MSRRPLAITALVLASAAAALSQDARAPLAVGSTTTVQSILAGQAGKPVTLMLDSGAEVSGTVKMAGDRAVHLTSLVGKEYYDAVVATDKITAVVVRAR